MKRILFLFIPALIITLSVNAQSKAENQVNAVVERLKQAMLDGNRAELEAVSSADLSYGHSSGKIQSQAEFVNQIATGGSDFVTIDLTEQTIKMVGKTALVRHKLSAKTNDNGTPGMANIGVLLVFQKQQGDWKLIGRQAFKL